MNDNNYIKRSVAVCMFSMTFDGSNSNIGHIIWKEIHVNNSKMKSVNQLGN